MKAIAKALAQRGKVEEATKIAQTLENEAVRSQVLDALANAQKRVRMSPVVTEAAEKTLKLTKELERRLGTHGLFQPLTKPLEEQVWLSRALNDARKLPAPESKVNRLVQIAYQLHFKSQRKETVDAILAEAIHYACEIKSPAQKASALVSIATHWEELGKWETAKKLKDETLRIQQRLIEAWGLKQSIIVMNAMRKGDLTELKKVVRKVLNPSIVGMLLHETVGKLARNGKVKEAIELANEFASNDYQRQSLMRVIAGAIEEMGKFEDVLAIASKLSTKDRVLFYPTITEIFQQGGQKGRAFDLMNEAFKLASSLPSGEADFVLGQIACLFAGLGESEKALEVFNRLKPPNQEIFCLQLASDLARGGDFETAIKIVRQIPAEKRVTVISYVAAIAEQQGKKEFVQKLHLEAQTLISVRPKTRP